MRRAGSTSSGGGTSALINGLLAALLHKGTHKLLRVHLQGAIDLVEQSVESVRGRGCCSRRSRLLRDVVVKRVLGHVLLRHMATLPVQKGVDQGVTCRRWVIQVHHLKAAVVEVAVEHNR